jgi:hypothetical protein
LFLLLFLLAAKSHSQELKNQNSKEIIFQENGSFGIKKSNGKILIAPIYKKIIALEESSFLVFSDSIKKKKKKGKVIFKQPIESYSICSNGFISIKNEKWFLINLKKKKIVFENLDDSVNWIGSKQEAGILKRNNVNALIDNKGKVKIPFEYASIQEAGDNSVILLKDNKYELFSTSGKALSKTSFNNLEKLDSNRILAKSGQWGIIDDLGKEIIPFEYDSIYQKSTQLLALSKQGRTAIMNREFKMILPYTFGYIGRMIGDFFVAQNGTYYGFYHQSGKEIFPWVYHEIYYNENQSILLLKKDTKWALADTSGKLFSSFIFDEIRMAKKPIQNNEQIIAIRINKLWGFLSKTGKLILTPQFESISSWNNESFIVRNNKHIGFYNAEGDKIYDTIYDDIKFIDEQLLAIKINGKYSFGEINSNKILFEPRFDEVTIISEDLIAVSINTKWGFATKKGGLAIPCIYNQTQAYHEGRACVKVFDKWGFIDKTGTMIINPKYDIPGNFDKGKVSLPVNGNWETVNRNGEILR